MVQKSIVFIRPATSSFSKRATGNETLSSANVSNYPLTCRLCILVSAYLQSLLYEKHSLTDNPKGHIVPGNQRLRNEASAQIRVIPDILLYHITHTRYRAHVWSFSTIFCHSAISSCYLTINQNIAQWRQKHFCCHNAAILLPFSCNQYSLT